MGNKLLYSISPKIDTPFHRWVIEYVVDMIGLIPVFSSAEDPNLTMFYGEMLNNENFQGIHIPHNPNDLINAKLLNDDKTNSDTFDFISAIGSFLLDKPNQNKPNSAFDKHRRLNSLNSFQAESGFQDKPIVNIYINYLSDLIDQKLRLDLAPRFPNGARAAVILSHDVDDPVKYSLLKSYKLFNPQLSFKNQVLYQLEAFKKALSSVLKKDGDENWAFKEVMDAENRYGFTSTFFFATRNRFAKYASYKYDVPYDVETPEFTRLFEELNERGFEIGLHASYFSKNSSKQLKEEIEKLEHVAKRKIVGNRHHFWQIGDQPEFTLKKHTEAGLKYDSSMAFNDAPGYRRSVALPYFPFDGETQSKINNLQIPTFLMDSNMMLNPQFGQEEASKQAKHYISELIKAGGVGAIDWHVRTSYPKNKRFQKWGETYLEILEYLGSKNELWVTNFESYYNWTLDRKKKYLNNDALKAT